jgi:5'-nucleotidase
MAAKSIAACSLRRRPLHPRERFVISCRVAQLRFLLTNDDGVEAAGLAALARAAERLTSVAPLVVAPALCHSGGGHQVTTRQPIKLVRRSEHCYTINGTPADCVRVALDQINPNVDWVLAGINHGGNLGADLYMSGTVAAVREAVLHGRPGIAVSYYHRKGVDPLDWQRAVECVWPVLCELVSQPWSPGTFWNVNLPHLPLDAADPEVAFCPVDPSPLPVAYRACGDELHYEGDYHQRPRQSGTDVDLCFRGKISVSLVRLFEMNTS